MKGSRSKHERPKPASRPGLPIEAKLLLVSMSIVCLAGLAAFELGSY